MASIKEGVRVYIFLMVNRGICLFGASPQVIPFIHCLQEPTSIELGALSGEPNLLDPAEVARDKTELGLQAGEVSCFCRKRPDNTHAPPYKTPCPRHGVCHSDGYPYGQLAVVTLVHMSQIPARGVHDIFQWKS
jgi:hypothetical protein